MAMIYTDIDDISEGLETNRAKYEMNTLSINYILSKNIIWGDVDSANMLGVEDEELPIELAIWSISANKIKRTDYRLDELISRSFRIDYNLFKGYDREITLTNHTRKYCPRSITNLHNDI